MAHRLMRAAVSLAGVPLFLVLAAAGPAAAQQPQTMTDILSFLLVNRSVSTGDPTRDEQAAQDVLSAFANFLGTELSRVPASSSAGGFSYRWDPQLGTSTRTSESFGPFFTERSLTIGSHQASFGVGYAHSVFDRIDGRSLTNGSLVVISSHLNGETGPFDAESLTLHITTDVATMSAHFGLTDRLDVSTAVPFITLRMDGQRVDTYRGTPFLEASAAATRTGLGDVLGRVKFNAIRSGASGLSFGADLTFPTGSRADLLGGGQFTAMPTVIASLEGERAGLHGEVGYVPNKDSRQWLYRAAFTLVGPTRVTYVAELLGLYLRAGGKLADVVTPRPNLVGVDTTRLTDTGAAASRATAAFGLRWNMASRWLLNAQVVRPLTSSGLTARWVPTVTLEVALGR